MEVGPDAGMHLVEHLRWQPHLAQRIRCPVVLTLCHAGTSPLTLGVYRGSRLTVTVVLGRFSRWWYLAACTAPLWAAAGSTRKWALGQRKCRPPVLANARGGLSHLHHLPG